MFSSAIAIKLQAITPVSNGKDKENENEKPN